MPWLLLRLAIAAALLSRGRSGRVTQLASVALLPPMLRPLAGAAVAIRFAFVAARFMSRW